MNNTLRLTFYSSSKLIFIVMMVMRVPLKWKTANIFGKEGNSLWSMFKKISWQWKFSTLTANIKVNVPFSCQSIIKGAWVFWRYLENGRRFFERIFIGYFGFFLLKAFWHKIQYRKVSFQNELLMWHRYLFSNVRT